MYKKYLHDHGPDWNKPSEFLPQNAKFIQTIKNPDTISYINENISKSNRPILENKNNSTNRDNYGSFLNMQIVKPVMENSLRKRQVEIDVEYREGEEEEEEEEKEEEDDFDSYILQQRQLANQLLQKGKKKEAEKIYIANSKAIIEFNRTYRSDVDADLHGMSEKELKIYLPFLLKPVDDVKATEPYKIDCGKGTHSINQIPVLAPILHLHLSEHGYKFREQGGTFSVFSNQSFIHATEFESFIEHQRQTANQLLRRGKKKEAEKIYLSNSTAIIKHNKMRRQDADANLHGMSGKELKIYLPVLFKIVDDVTSSKMYKISCVSNRNQISFLAPILRLHLSQHGYSFKEELGTFSVFHRQPLACL